MKFPSFRRKNPKKIAAEALYAAISERSRDPVFFRDLGVADTVDGRFDMVVLHGILVMRRLKTEGPEAVDLAQHLFDTIFGYFDDSLRAMGVGDLSVGKRVKKMAEAFYGRVEAYEKPLIEADLSALSLAVQRNVFRGGESESSSQDIARYMIRVAQDLDGHKAEDLMKGRLVFPPVIFKPAPEAAS